MDLRVLRGHESDTSGLDWRKGKIGNSVRRRPWRSPHAISLGRTADCDEWMISAILHRHAWRINGICIAASHRQNQVPAGRHYSWKREVP
jgi:hypothetical protein